MSIVIKSGASSNLASVDGSGSLQVNLTTVSGTAGYAKLAGRLDGNGVDVLDNHLMVGGDTPTIRDVIEGLTLNTNTWTTSNFTFTTVQNGGYIVLNAASGTNTNSYSSITSVKQIRTVEFPMHLHWRAKPTITPQSNCTMELGFGFVSGTTAPTNGAFFRWSSAGDFVCVAVSASVETSSPTFTAPTANSAHDFEIIIGDHQVIFTIDDQVATIIQTPTAEAVLMTALRAPVFARVYTAGVSPSSAPQLRLGPCAVYRQVIPANKPWAHQIADMGRGTQQSPFDLFGQTANHANSANPTAGALSNTVASYTTLGGRFVFAMVGGAPTDYALFGYQVPTGSTLTITDMSISTMNSGSAGIANLAAIALDWSVATNASAVSLATADAPTAATATWAPRRIPLGMQGLPVFATTGTMFTPPELVKQFTTPLIVDGGRFFHVILQIPTGTAQATQFVRGDVWINGYFET